MLRDCCFRNNFANATPDSRPRNNVVDVCSCMLHRAQNLVDLSLYVSYAIHTLHDRDVKRLLASMGYDYEHVAVFRMYPPLVEE